MAVAAHKGLTAAVLAAAAQVVVRHMVKLVVLLAKLVTELELLVELVEPVDKWLSIERDVFLFRKEASLEVEYFRVLVVLKQVAQVVVAPVLHLLAIRT